MNRCAPLCLAVLLPTLAMAADIPDMKGDWAGTAEPIVAGRGGPHWPESKGTWDKPALSSRPLTVHVTGQDGRRFWGKVTLGGAEGSGMATTEEPLIATLAPDGSTLFIVTANGYVAGNVEGKTLSYCYAQTGAKKDGDGPAVAACADLTKK